MDRAHSRHPPAGAAGGNLGAAGVELTPGDLAAIGAAADKITVVGERYPEAMQQMIDR